MIESDAVVTRQRPLTNGFKVKLQEEENADRVHVQEPVGYVVFESGTGSNNNNIFEAALTPNSVRHTWYNLNFIQTYPQEPLFLASMTTQNGGDTAGIRYRNLYNSTVQIKIEEEKSKNTEVYHVTETVGYLVFEKPGNIMISPT